MNNAVEILDQGFACLVENLGVVDAEHFIALIKRDNFDYTVWQILQYFIIYSFIGCIIETIFGLLTKGVVESRQSILYGPFCCIYGLGALCLLCIPPKAKKNSFSILLSIYFLVLSILLLVWIHFEVQ